MGKVGGAGKHHGHGYGAVSAGNGDDDAEMKLPPGLMKNAVREAGDDDDDKEKLAARRAEAERQAELARLEAERQAQAEAEQRARAEAERRTRLEAEQRAQLERRLDKQIEQQVKVEERRKDERKIVPRSVRIVERYTENTGVDRTRTFTATIYARKEEKSYKLPTENVRPHKRREIDDRYDGFLAGILKRARTDAASTVSVPSLDTSGGRTLHELILHADAARRIRERQSDALRHVADFARRHRL